MRVFAILLVALVACSDVTSKEDQERSASPTPADGQDPPFAQPESNPSQLSEPPARPSDSDLERSISARLLGDTRTADAVLGIDVDVTAGIAVLTGTARSQEQADVVELLVRDVPGVTRVDNFIEINEFNAPRTNRLPSSQPTDEVIRATVLRELGPGTTIEVAVDKGVVTFGGIANSEELRDATAIAKIAGARQVIDQTRLVPLEISP